MDEEIIDNMPVAVITGAARGIGKALVEVLNNNGYRVIAVVRRSKDADDLDNSPKNILAINCDITEGSSEKTLHDYLKLHTKKVDLLVNNAGVDANGHGIEGLKYDELDHNLAVHCYGAVRCIRACLPFLRCSAKPLIINMSSACASHELLAKGKVSYNEVTLSYQLAQGAVNMLTASLSAELHKDNIHVLSFDPGPVKTRLGPANARTTPEQVAMAILDLSKKNTDTGIFLHLNNSLIPW